MIILSWISFVFDICVVAVPFFPKRKHTERETERRMSPNPFERIADHKADSRLLFTCRFLPWTLSSSICSACLCLFLALPVSTFRPATRMTTMTCNRWWWTNVKSQFFTTNENVAAATNVPNAFHANAFWKSKPKITTATCRPDF